MPRVSIHVVPITVKSETSWQLKTRQLDRYRWLLLRERHGRLGSALRFVREALVDLCFGLGARLRLAMHIDAQPCDFLLLQSSPKVIKLRRKKLLIEALAQRGHGLVETALQESWVILRQRLLAPPPAAVPLRYFGYAAHAEWLVSRYRPKVLLNDRNGSLYSPFLRLALNSRGSLLVHLAHATTLEASRRLGMNDYDYYFLFGQSSLQALQARSPRFGDSQAVLAGSHMIDRSYDQPLAEPAQRVMLVLGVGPDKEKEAGYQRTYALLRDWAIGHPEYRVLVKAHPRSQVPFWRQAAAGLSNLEVLPRGCSLAEALGRASLVVNIMSNAVIEAALAGRPVIYANASGQADIFAQEQYFGGCVDSPEGMERRGRQIEAEYVQSCEAARRFADYHLAQGVAGLERTLELLERLLAGEVIESQSLVGTVDI